MTDQRLNLEECRDLLAEERAQSIGRFDSLWIPEDDKGDLVRVFEVGPVPDKVEQFRLFLSDYTSAKNQDKSAVVTDPMVDGVVHEGVYRRFTLRKTKMQQDGAKTPQPVFYLVQTLRKGLVTKVCDGQQILWDDAVIRRLRIN